MSLAARALLAIAASSLLGAAPLPLAFLPPSGSTRPSAQEPSRKRPSVNAAPVLRAGETTVVSLHLREAIVVDPAAMTAQERPLLYRLLRDRTSWQERSIEQRTVEMFLRTIAHFSATRVEIVSGYRSDKLNEMLRKKGRHVARHSQHVLATAIDFRPVGVPSQELFRFLEREHDGGVGRYRDNAFVHIDAGNRRRWRGE